MKCPVLPLRDYLVFPDCYAPVFVGREASLKAIQMTCQNEGRIVVCAQRDAKDLEPRTLSDLYSRGTLCSIARQTQYPGDQAKAILCGERLFNIERVWFDEGVLWAEGETVDDVAADQSVSADEAAASETLLRQWYGERAVTKMDEFFEKFRSESRLSVHTNKLCGELSRWQRRDKYLRESDGEIQTSPKENSELLRQRQALLENESARERFLRAHVLMREEIVR
jgi:ATP-dependent Lon protease